MKNALDVFDFLVFVGLVVMVLLQAFLVGRCLERRPPVSRRRWTARRLRFRRALAMQLRRFVRYLRVCAEIGLFGGVVFALLGGLRGCSSA